MAHSLDFNHKILLYIKACTLSKASLLVTSLCLIVLFSACSSKKFLKTGEHTLSDVEVKAANKHFATGEYKNYVRQQPNAKWFTLFKVPLGIYCLSKADSIKGKKGLSKIWKKIGEAPVIYDTAQTLHSQTSIRQALNSKGYLHAEVDTIVSFNKHKAKVIYLLRPGMRHYIHELKYQFDDEALRQQFRLDSASTLIRKGMPLDLGKLADERARIIKALHERGYYYLNNDYISYDIDTLAGSLESNVILHFRKPENARKEKVYTQQKFRNVNITADDLTTISTERQADTLYYRGLNFVYHGKQKLFKRLFVSHVGLRPDSTYRESQVQNTYSSLNALPITSYTTIHIEPVKDADSLLDCNIYLQRNKPHSIGLELEGTNTSGDLGAALALTYSNRNFFRSSELLTLKIRSAYEAITGLEGYSNQNYMEWSAEANLRLPTLLLPFVSIEKKRQLKAASEAKVMFDTQDRPEFHRRVLTGAWSYVWNRADKTQLQHHFDMLSVNYVYMPWISDTFKKNYLEGNDPHYSVLRYSYENLFIVRTGYSFTYNSLRDAANMPTGLYQTNGYQVRFGIELAGNVLYGISRAIHGKRNASDPYNLFGIAYSQYAKIDFDFAKSVVLSERNSLAFHVGFGIGLPYGNSTIMPYEKRYFAGGANSVRGWSVRELGPGSYKGKDSKVDFVNQTGNMKLDLNLELRTFLFWKLHGAFFIDAGNVWNTRSYPDMDGALFKLNSFYKQIAVAYGLGIRFNFNYFILRLDGGMKAINPAVSSGRLHYPISKPNFGRDFTLHFAVGLPF
uniref:translocation and assembly module lipoprotein TamL n=1 Tax=Alloprevotella sp. TaxID=1872471 RepID=UPI00402716AE